MWLILWKNIVFVNICPVLLLCTKELFTTYPKKILDLFLFKLVEKNKLSISELLSESPFLTIKRFFSEFHWNCFKTTGKHSLAACGSLWGENLFWFIFVQFLCFYLKQLFKQFQILLRICPNSKLLRKTNFLSISLLLSEKVNFWLKEMFSVNFPENASKQQESIV